MASTGLGDSNVATSKHGGVEHDFDAWKSQFWLQSVKHFHADAVYVPFLSIRVVAPAPM